MLIIYLWPFYDHHYSLQAERISTSASAATLSSASRDLRGGSSAPPGLGSIGDGDRWLARGTRSAPANLPSAIFGSVRPSGPHFRTRQFTRIRLFAMRHASNRG